MQITIDEQRFKAWLEVKGLAERSTTEYLRYLKAFNVEKLSYDYMLAFLKRYPNSIARAFISNLILYIRTTDYPDNVKSFAAGLLIPKVTGRKRKIVPDFLTREEVYKLVRAMKNKRNSLMLLVQFYGGLRVSELCSLKPWDFNWNYWVAHPEKNGKLKVVHGKGNKQRIVFTPRSVMKNLYHYVRSVASARNKEEHLFKIRPKTWLKIIHATSDGLGFNKNIKTHTIRHSCNQWLRENGWDASDRKEYLGHENITTTTTYDHVYTKKLKDKFDKLI